MKMGGQIRGKAVPRGSDQTVRKGTIRKVEE